MKCEDCLGTGYLCVEDTIGGHSSNGPWQSYKIRRIECEECRGFGEVDED